MDDDQFLDAFERCEIPNDQFHHRDHVRLAWIYLRKYGFDEAALRIGQSIRNFAAHHGANSKYDQVLTVAWLRRVDDAMRSAPGVDSFGGLVDKRPELLIWPPPV